MAEESKEQREGRRDDRGRKVEWKGKVGEWERKQSKESEIYRESQKLNNFYWRPCFKQRSLFSDRDPPQEIELENRLIEPVQVALWYCTTCASASCEQELLCILLCSVSTWIFVCYSLTYTMQPHQAFIFKHWLALRQGLVCLQTSFRSFMFGLVEERCSWLDCFICFFL